MIWEFEVGLVSRGYLFCCVNLWVSDLVLFLVMMIVWVGIISGVGVVGKEFI